MNGGDDGLIVGRTLRIGDVDGKHVGFVTGTRLERFVGIVDEIVVGTDEEETVDDDKNGVLVGTADVLSVRGADEGKTTAPVFTTSCKLAETDSVIFCHAVVKLPKNGCIL